ncbi:hypothetical protein [Gimesia sp.]|uniref:hypothetical protein n=1 Tax=Gimesia sp. TaxID=2024833 RepID=UPI003A940B4F
MTEKFSLTVTKRFASDLAKLVKWWKQQQSGSSLPAESGIYDTDYHPPIHYYTLEPYSTYIIKQYPADSYDLDGDSRSLQEYLVMVDGDEPIQVGILYYDPNGNHRQLVSIVGDGINGEIKLVLDGHETEPISLNENGATVEKITAALEKLPSIGRKNVSVSVFPGRWIIEFTRDLAGQTFDLFVVDKPEDSAFEVHVSVTKYADSGKTADLHYPIPLIGKWDGDDNAINDAVASGSKGTAQWFPGQGYVSDLNECRDHNGDGTPNL